MVTVATFPSELTIPSSSDFTGQYSWFGAERAEMYMSTGSASSAGSFPHDFATRAFQVSASSLISGSADFENVSIASYDSATAFVSRAVPIDQSAIIASLQSTY